MHYSLPDGDGVECVDRVHVGPAYGPLGEGRVHLPGGAQVGYCFFYFFIYFYFITRLF